MLVDGAAVSTRRESRSKPLSQVPAADLIAQHPETDERLRNWARWGRERSGPGRLRCQSAEGRYMPDAGEVWGGAVAVVPVDSRDAEIVERAVCRLRPAGRIAVRAWYVDGAHAGAGWPAVRRRACRAAGLGASWFDAVLGAAVAEIAIMVRSR
jgi:hypothetical protein